MFAHRYLETAASRGFCNRSLFRGLMGREQVGMFLLHMTSVVGLGHISYLQQSELLLIDVLILKVQDPGAER